MTLRSRILLAALVLFDLVNLLGLVYAAVLGEGLHAGTHALLLLAGGYATWRMLPRRLAMS